MGTIKNRRRRCTISSRGAGRGLLLEYVFLEVMTILMVRRDLSAGARVGEILLEAEELEFVPCSDFFLETMEFFSKLATNLSFTDSAIGVVGGDLGESR